VAKVAGTSVIRLSTATTRLPVIKNSHAWIKEAANARLISIIGAGIRNFHYRPFFNLFRAENPELDTHHGLNIRIWTIYSGGHLSSVL
jgi:hypothetical protein